MQFATNLSSRFASPSAWMNTPSVALRTQPLSRYFFARRYTKGRKAHPLYDAFHLNVERLDHDNPFIDVRFSDSAFSLEFRALLSKNCPFELNRSKGASTKSTRFFVSSSEPRAPMAPRLRVGSFTPGGSSSRMSHTTSASARSVTPELSGRCRCTQRRPRPASVTKSPEACAFASEPRLSASSFSGMSFSSSADKMRNTPQFGPPFCSWPVECR